MKLMLGLFICTVAVLRWTSGTETTVCTADTPSSQWVRRGNHLRERGECQQGFHCDGNQISPLRKACPELTYFSVHTGTCSFPNLYNHVYSSFNCSAEEADENLDFEKLSAKRGSLCEPLMANVHPDLTELYVGDPDNCRQMFKCPLVAVHDDWLHTCPLGQKFKGGSTQDVEGVCEPDLDGCGWLRK